MSDDTAKLTGFATGLDAAAREKWAREALHGIELRAKRFGEFVGAVRWLIATLPKCTWHCGKPALQERGVWVDEGNDYVGKDYACGEHAHLPHHTTGTDPWVETSWAPALRKLQAMLDPDETEKKP